MTEKPNTTGDKRERLTRAAADLTYAHGFSQVALADVAEAAEVPLGNVYYYFKTKAALGGAVIAQRSEEFEWLRGQWEMAATPKERLKAFVRSTADNRYNLVRAGCPVGSLIAELGKGETPLANAAAGPLRALLGWIEDQFSALHCGADSRGLALHLMAAIQGVSLLANAFRDSDLVVGEAEVLNAWIDTIA